MSQIESDVRDAYFNLVDRPGLWVGLAELREQMPSHDRRSVDATLVEMAQMKDVRIIPVANSKALNDKDRAAALRMGGENHNAFMIRN